MKQFKYILASLVLLVPALTHAASDDDPAVYTKYNYKIDNGVATRKYVSPADNNNLYTLTLETFVTGAKSIIKTFTPVDVVLILDTSYSMDHDAAYSYKDDDGNLVNSNRLAALKYAVNKFVHQIAVNDGYSDDEGTIRRVDSNNNPTTLGNRIQIIRFDSQARVTWTQGFRNAFENEATIQSAVRGFTTTMGTRTDQGMSTGLTWIQTSVNERPNSNRVVVMFTDGCPASGSYSSGYDNIPGSGSYKFRSDYAASAVNSAKSIKALGATVYSIGLIDWDALRTQGDESYPGYVLEMMEHISSNFPDGSATNVLDNRTGTNTLTCTGTRASSDYYFDANDMDLGDIFKSIGQASGGSENTVPEEAQLVDEVSSSFEIPSTTTIKDIVIYTRSVKSDGSDWVETTTPNTLNKVSLPADYDLTKLPPENIATQIAPENTVGVYLKDGKLVIIGFNYSKDDSEGTDGTEGKEYDGNWVGWRPLGEDGDQICVGQELVVEIKIEAIDGVTGGDHTNTNTKNSGVYVPTYDDQGNFTGFVNATYYPYPDTDLPINLVIVKKNLRPGESATVQIYRAPQKAGEYDPGTGKPAPDLSNGWENFSKVILTNKGNTIQDVTKTLLSLDPKYVYRLKEDDWSWAYTLDTKEYNTSAKEANPFTFTNTEKEVTVKHAEAVSINHFGSNGVSAHAETYKSSKLESF